MVCILLNGIFQTNFPDIFICRELHFKQVQHQNSNKKIR